MDISGITQKSLPQFNNSTSEATAGAKAATMNPVKRSDTVSEPVKIPQIEEVNLKQVDEKRFNAIKKTIERETSSGGTMISDSRFTIFKDSKSGQYITRFTNLQNGAVTYVPEPDILKLAGSSDAYFEFQA